MLLDRLRDKRDLINAACRQLGAGRIRVVSPVARGEERPESDIRYAMWKLRAVQERGRSLLLSGMNVSMHRHQHAAHLHIIDHAGSVRFQLSA